MHYRLTMLIKQQKGFLHIEILAVVAVVAIVAAVGLFVMGKGDSQQDDAKETSSATESPDQLTLYNLGIASLDEVNVSADATRDFTKSGHKGFYIFGDILPGTPVRHNPNFEFASMKEDAKLISAIDGVVGFTQMQQDSNDYEVFLMTSEQSNWVIGYDHVVDPKVKKGDIVKVGDLIGYPARQGNGLLRFEFQVNKNNGGQDGLHICPVTLLDASVIDSWTTQLKEIQDKWEDVSGLELYDTSTQDPVGCIGKDMTPAFAQGESQ